MINPNMATLTPGFGYWARFPSAITVSGPGSAVSSPVNVALATGWNQIGDPFTTTLAETSITVKQTGVADTTLEQLIASGGASSLWGYDNSAGGYTLATSIAPYTGYWLYVYAPTTLVETAP
jgi:hypothetical protein